MSHRYQQATFSCSVHAAHQLPKDAVVEVAFAGRSNAGKSSALNALTNQATLARVSKTPGRTQLINYFALPDAGKYLVDLPGYGYAQVPDAVRQYWEHLLGDYLLTRQALKGVVLIMDIRHPLKPLDQQLLDCCQARALPVHVLLTKADKLSKSAQKMQQNQVANFLAQRMESSSVQTFSSLKKEGLDALRCQLDQWLGG